MPLTGPVDISLSPCGVIVEETIHSRDFHMKPTVDPFHEIFHVLHGHISLVLGPEQTEVPMPQGSYGIVAAGTLHRVIDSAASTLILLCASNNVIERSEERTYIWNQLVAAQPWVASPHLREEADNLHTHWRRLLGLQQHSARPASRLRIFTEFDACLLALYDLLDGDTSATTDERVRTVIQLVAEQCDERWTVGRAARRAGLSERRFSQLFRSITGTTFVPWLNEQRVQRACRVLATGRYTIASAAFASGFEDLSHFYHVFQKLCGRTPRQWVLDNKEDDISSATRRNEARQKKR